MPSGKPPYFISTTIPYVNAPPHLGHAFEFVQADAFARHHRLRGEDVFFLSGSDENSLKNVLAAEAAGMETREFVQANVEAFLSLEKPLGLSYDRFIRTGLDEDHIVGATEFWKRLVAADDVYTQEYGGLYCVGCEQFYTEDELVDGLCPEHHTPLEFVQEENYFFRLSRYQDELERLISSGALEIRPESRRNEVLSFVRAGLRDFSISRSQARARGWGIAVPGDPEQVMYVWVDALTNYINALGYATDGELYRKFWSGDSSRVHVLGKGVTRFHAVYWPAMLLSAGVPLPTTLFVHGYITLQGSKMSKSSGNSQDVSSLVEQYGSDPLRYFLLRHTPPTGDADFSVERLVETYNSDLANGLGNLVSRVVRMVESYREGVVPTSGAPSSGKAATLKETVIESRTRSDTALDDYDHREALVAIWDAVRATNGFIHDTEPWALARDVESSDQLDEVLRTSCEAIRQVGNALRALLPRTAERVLEGIGAANVPNSSWDDAALGGKSVSLGKGLFPRISAG